MLVLQIYTDNFIFARVIERIAVMDNFEQYGIFQRSAMLLGEKAQAALESSRVILFGVGGVGSWCAEALVRSGIRRLTIVDSDVVNESNVNRQLMATSATIGEVKVNALKERLLQINPDAEINPVCERFTADSAASFHLDEYDYIIDAIDSLKDKSELILRACETDAVFFSSMGAARKIDPTRVKVADFWKVRDCPLGAALRKKLRREGTLPQKSFLCVYGDEVLPVVGGSLVTVTAVFGMNLAALVIKDAYSR